MDDAATARRLVCLALASDPALEVVGTAANGRQALDRLDSLRPDAVILDLEMPVLDGFQTLAELRRLHPRLPVVIFSSLTARAAAATLDALALGANDYVTKPRGGSFEASLRHAREELVPRLRALCAPRHLAGAPPAGAPPGSAPIARVRRGGRPSHVEVVAIATSTGGPNALAAILPQLPADFPVPILIVQHMPPLFTAHLAERLAARCALPVAEGVAGEILRPGAVRIAPGDWHMEVRRAGVEVRLELHQGPLENSCRPSADVLLRSVAEVYGSGVLAVVLTGMGQDGLRGSAEVLRAGGRVVAQDADSSAVWGMPRAVVRAGLAEAVLPLGEIGPEIARRALHGRRGGEAAA